MVTPYNPPIGPLNLIEVTADWVLVDKPSGLLSVPGRGTEKADCLQARLKQEFGEALTVHRLDMETSGVMVFARTPKAQSILSSAFENRQVQKSYEAVVWGEVSEVAGEINLPLIADWPNRPRQKVCHETGKASVTQWHVREHLGGRTRLSLTPITGRSHQLRVHLLAIGHPILGDSLYGKDEVRDAAPRLLLHATQLRFAPRADMVMPIGVSAAPF
ncbi:MAG: pseudouridine synthase [Pseudomonadota bacterium]